MNINIQNNWLKADNTQNGEIITLLDEGLEKEFENKDGTKKTVYNFRVRNSKNEEMSYTPNNTSLKAFVKIWGSASDMWVNQKFKVEHVSMMIQGQPKKVIIAEPLLLAVQPTFTEEVVQ